MRLINSSKLLAIGAVSLMLASWAPANMAADTYTLLYVGDTEFDKHAYRGARQGLKEANHQAAFMNIAFELETILPEDYDPDRIGDSIAVLVAADARTVREVVESTGGIAVLNLFASNDALREACYENAFHIIPSDRMFADAEAQWRRKNPESSARAYAWHHTFGRYAAADLNKRFKQEQGKGKGMTDEAWAAWAAVRLTAESVLRLQTGDPERVLNYFRTDLFFDGQKGYEMDFRETGQLRQLVLLVEDDNVVGEAPVRGVVEDESDLDTLGLTECK